MGWHQATTRAPPKCGSQAPLTLVLLDKNAVLLEQREAQRLHATMVERIDVTRCHPQLESAGSDRINRPSVSQAVAGGEQLPLV